MICHWVKKMYCIYRMEPNNTMRYKFDIREAKPCSWMNDCNFYFVVKQQQSAVIVLQK